MNIHYLTKPNFKPHPLNYVFMVVFFLLGFLPASDALAADSYFTYAGIKLTSSIQSSCVAYADYKYTGGPTHFEYKSASGSGSNCHIVYYSGGTAGSGERNSYIT
ncbi:MAG: hypothetical protein ACKVJE_22240, partial [Pseudomonadales bacterium]